MVPAVDHLNREQCSPASAKTLSEWLSQSAAKARGDHGSWDYILRSGLAGAIAGCVAKSAIAPLDRVKILFQASNPDFKKYAGSLKGTWFAVQEIHRQGGLFGLFQGHSATLLRIAPYAAIKFMAYEQFHHLLMPDRTGETALRLFAAGAMAGVTSVFFTYPLDLVRVRLAYETRAGRGERPSLRHLIRLIYLEGGNKEYHGKKSGSITQFYRGFSTTILGMIPYAGVSFLVHDGFQNLTRQYLPSATSEAKIDMRTVYQSTGKNKEKIQAGKRKRPLKTWAELTCGGLAGALAQTASYPFEVIRRRMQVGGVQKRPSDGQSLKTGPPKFLGLVETFRTIVAENGLKGLWVGLSIGYIKVVPMVAISFYCYEKSKEALGL